MTDATARALGVLANVFPWDTDREKIQLLSRYEVTLERSLYRAHSRKGKIPISGG
jgi:hypothetical protein